jgi:hypothetical protein
MRDKDKDQLGLRKEGKEKTKDKRQGFVSVERGQTWFRSQGTGMKEEREG